MVASAAHEFGGRISPDGRWLLYEANATIHVQSFPDPDGGNWRMFHFIEGTRTYQTATTPHHAHQAAWTVGRMQQMLISLPGEPLHETIPDFHNTPLRFRQLEQAVAQDSCQRLSEPLV